MKHDGHRKPPQAPGLTLPGVWEDIGDGYYVKRYSDESRWLEANVNPDGPLRLQAFVSGIVGGVMRATECDAKELLDPTDSAAIEQAITSLELRLACELKLPLMPVPTTTMKVQGLSGMALNWAVANGLGCELVSARDNFRRIAMGAWSEEKLAQQLGKMADEQMIINPMSRNAEPLPGFSTFWQSGGPIIDRERIDVVSDPNGTAGWMGRTYVLGRESRMFGPTALIAAMRCFVAGKLGEEVEIPTSLVA